MEDLVTFERRKRKAEKEVTYDELLEKEKNVPEKKEKGKGRGKKSAKNKKGDKKTNQGGDNDGDVDNIDIDEETKNSGKTGWEGTKVFDLSKLKSEKFEAYYKVNYLIFLNIFYIGTTISLFS
jgi:hypothetical protein